MQFSMHLFSRPENSLEQVIYRTFFGFSLFLMLLSTLVTLYIDITNQRMLMDRAIAEGAAYIAELPSVRTMIQSGYPTPATVEELRSLPGIGDYTAGAIASLAFHKPEPALHHFGIQHARQAAKSIPRSQGRFRGYHRFRHDLDPPGGDQRFLDPHPPAAHGDPDLPGPPVALYDQSGPLVYKVTAQRTRPERDPGQLLPPGHCHQRPGGRPDRGKGRRDHSVLQQPREGIP